MAPSAWRGGGRGAVIRWASGQTSLGPILLAATEKGICRLTFGDDPAVLARDFPQARIEPGGGAMAELVASAIALVEEPGRARDLPLDIRGTAFQEAVWRELSRVPPGGSVSYAALAVRAGKPRRGDGSASGYAPGLEMKASIFRHEAI